MERRRIRVGYGAGVELIFEFDPRGGRWVKKRLQHGKLHSDEPLALINVLAELPSEEDRARARSIDPSAAEKLPPDSLLPRA